MNTVIKGLVLLSVQAVLTNGSFLGYCQYGSILPNLAAICASIYHTNPDPSPNPNPIDNPNPKSYPNLKLFNK